MQVSAENYNQKYYQRNREAIRARRRALYLKSKKYREACIARARAQTASKAAIRLTVPKTVVHCRKTELRFTISQVAERINRSTDALYRWRSSGILPKATYLDARKNGIYAESQVLALVHVVGMIDAGSELSYKGMSKILKQIWNKTYNKDEVYKLIKKESHEN